jgi:hypothetical protein
MATTQRMCGELNDQGLTWTPAAHQWCVDEGVGHCRHAPAANVDVSADLEVVKLHFNLGQLNANPADRPTISQGVNPLAAATVQNVKEAVAPITSGTAATCRRVEASCNKQQPVDISSCQHPIMHEAQLPRKHAAPLTCPSSA